MPARRCGPLGGVHGPWQVTSQSGSSIRGQHNLEFCRPFQSLFINKSHNQQHAELSLSERLSSCFLRLCAISLQFPSASSTRYPGPSFSHAGPRRCLGSSEATRDRRTESYPHNPKGCMPNYAVESPLLAIESSSPWTKPRIERAAFLAPPNCPWRDQSPASPSLPRRSPARARRYARLPPEIACQDHSLRQASLWGT